LTSAIGGVTTLRKTSDALPRSQKAPVPFQRIQTKKKSTYVAEQTLQAIRVGQYRLGDRLPPERVLAEEMGVSRPSVRGSSPHFRSSATWPAGRVTGTMCTPRRTPQKRCRPWRCFILNDARPFFTTAWWLGIFPGLAIMVVVLSINFVGDGLRDLLDVKEYQGMGR